MSEKMLRNVVSVDVEDYFHAEAFSDVVDRARWDSYTSRVEVNTRRLLELMAKLNMHATFFRSGVGCRAFPGVGP
jgi:peptidoglycan-N-acetylglucosamine deacetylase